MKPACLICLLLVGMSACGGDLKYIDKSVQTDATWRVISQPTGRHAKPVTVARPVPTPAARIPIRSVAGLKGSYLAVFDIQDNSRKLKKAEIDGLTDYLSGKLAEGGLFRVVPRQTIKERLLSQKKESFRACYDQSCQIEIGREIAAQKTLSVTIAPIGSTCTITAGIFDLIKSATDTTATARGGCSPEALVEQIEQIVAKFRQAAQ